MDERDTMNDGNVGGLLPSVFCSLFIDHLYLGVHSPGNAKTAHFVYFYGEECSKSKQSGFDCGIFGSLVSSLLRGFYTRKMF